MLDELARAMPQGGLELAEPACWGAAASNAVVARGRGAAARLRWLALARRAAAASWCFLSFEEFVQSLADAVEGRRRALRDAPVSCVAQTSAEPTSVVDEAPPRADVSAEGKALSNLEGVFPVVVAAIPQIVSVHVVGSSEEDVWRVVRSALPDRSKTCLGREEFVRDVWPALWGAFGERWRSKQ